jgi:hypothetical protein
MNQMQSIYDLFRGEKGKKESYANIAGGVVSICVVIGVRSLGGKKKLKNFAWGWGRPSDVIGYLTPLHALPLHYLYLL